MQEKIDYINVIELGFERQDMEDNIFFRQNGYNCFLVTKKLCKGIVAEWCCQTKTVELVRYKKHCVKCRLPIKNLDELKRGINFFKQQ